MSEKKDIDHLFQNKFEHFEVAPPEMVWENIEAKLLKKKEKRRVVPFWWKFAGVAALLLVGFGLYTAYFSDNKPTNNPVVNQVKTTNQNANDLVKEDATTILKDIVQGEEKSNDSTIHYDKTINASAEKNNLITITEKNKDIDKAIVSTSNNKKEISNSIKNKSSARLKITNSDTLIASNANPVEPNKKRSNLPIDKVNSKDEKDRSTPITANVKESKTTGQKTIVEGIAPTNGKNFSTDTNRKTQFSTPENIEKELQEIKKIDSTKVATVEPNALEELLNEKEKKITKEQKLNRWQVTPNIAPIYFSSLSSGSPLDEKLTANKKVYGTNYSYGLAINYSINKKYSIRTGVHAYAVDYDTKDIVFYQDTNASKMQNLSPNPQGSFIQIDPLNNVNASFGRILGEKFEGILNQKTGYIEVPFEVTYKVLSKKFGVDVIGGISTLFLNQNDVYLKASGFNMKIGEASNLNTVHFSTNIGLGLKYAFLKRFDLRVEPLFKYQLNTYSSGAGNFKPYIFGIYSGISYHF